MRWLTATAVILFCNLQLGITAKAQSSFTLQQAIDYAFKNSSTVKNAVLDEKITEGKVKEFRGIGLPQIKGSAQSVDNFAKQTFVFPTQNGPQIIQVGSTYSTQAGVSGSWLVADATYFLGLKAQQEIQKLMTFNTQRNKITVAESVAKAYYNVLISSQQLKSLDANINRTQQQYDELKEINKQGLAEGLDVQRLEIFLNNLKSNKNKAQEFSDLAKSMLKFQMGFDVSQSIDLSDTLSENVIKELSNFDSNVNLNSRIEIQLLNKQLELNKLNLKRYQLGCIPNLVAFAQYNTNHYSEKLDFFKGNAQYYNSGLWGLQMNVTFWDGMQNKNRKAYTKLEILKNENDIANAKNGFQFELNNAKISIKNSFLTLNDSKKNIELSNEVVRVARIKYKEGVGSSLEVLNAETSLRDAQTFYFSALYDAYIAKVNYEKATGTLVK
jgi:outer membrane protein TolC